MTDRQHVNERLESELGLLWRRVRRLSIDLARQVDAGIEISSYGLLGALADGGDLRAGDLADRFGLDKSTVSRQITQLETHGLIQRVHDPMDRRSRLIHVTGEGLALVRELRAARGRWLGDALADWPDSDVDTLVVLLARLNASITPE
ncbi:MarR family winged helix-turn-helix transcriptional regulator [Jiangella asiatica]|uniref:MarR family transcriptional regulator n=1 Tax=Jiangella asiatica TaxID=2530372 RepID=A0A4R5DIX0_9ACTN|nr:MarR family transcriptional regulator [Jiangella asiatica]TDE14072.1 MarR family transcriptional regulator [Jiangella asiatica]